MVPKLPRISSFRPTPRTSLKPCYQTSLLPLRHLTLSASSSLHTTDTLPSTSTSSSSSNPCSTVNQDEIAHFSRLSSLWWDERGEFGMLHKMNPVRMQFIRQKLAEIAQEDSRPETEIELSKDLQGLDVLDVGCGGGLLSESLTRRGANTLGIDASSSNISIASLHASQDPGLAFGSSYTHVSGKGKGKGKLRYEHTSVEDLLSRVGPSAFDVVCCMEVLEHVDHPREFLKICATLVRPGGHLFLSTISRTPLSYFLTILSAEHILNLVEPGTHTWSKYINPTELIDFFRQYPSPSHSPINSNTTPTTTPTTTAPNPPRQWIQTQTPADKPLRTEAETRGIIYHPWTAEWVLVPREGSFGLSSLVGKEWTEGCNYLFWVRRPFV